MGQLTCARLQKSQQLVRQKPNSIEASLFTLERLNVATTEDPIGIATGSETLNPPKPIMPVPADGFSILAGGLSIESNLAAGIDYARQEVLRGRVNFRASGRWSVRKYQRYVFEAEIPRLFGSGLFLNFRGIQRNYPDEDFYGIGPSSDLANRSDFRFDATDIGFATGLHLSRGLRLQAFGGLLNTNVGPGQDKQLPTVEQVFSPDQAPGLLVQPDYRYAGAALDFDYRDEPVYSTVGGYYRVGWTYFDDKKLAPFSFRQYAAELRQYLPVFSRNRVVALRALSILTDTIPGNEVPFFMMGALGGIESLRGFADARFRDRNYLLMNAEYRWTVFTQMDAVVFADAGKVFPKVSQIGFKNLETSYGFGARFKTPKGPLLRLEVGFSNEANRIGIVFRPPF